MNRRESRPGKAALGTSQAGRPLADQSSKVEDANALNHCRSCGETVFWTTTARNHKRIPLNPEPFPGSSHKGNLELRGELAHYVASESKRPEGAYWEAHWATCGRRKGCRK
jgi:hypothetical protein